MRRRSKVSKRSSKRMFAKTARKTHKRNRLSGLMRGGIRL